MAGFMKELYGTPNQFIDAWKAQGKKIIGTVCCHIPEELVYAAGILPIRIRATDCRDDSKAALLMSNFSCSFSRGALEKLQDGTYDFLDGIICSDGCDMIHRVYDNWEYFEQEGKFKYRFWAPRIVHPGAPKKYIDQCLELKEALEKFSGNKITDEKLAEAIAVYNESRVLINRLYELRKRPNPPVSGEDCLEWTLASMSMPKDIFNKLLGGFLDKIDLLPPITDKRARIIWTGGPVDEPGYLKIFEDRGALIVNDFQCFGRGRNIDIIPEPKAGQTWYDTLVDTYLNAPLCPRMPQSYDAIFDTIKGMVKEYNADGVVFCWVKNCEIYGPTMAFARKYIGGAGIPLLLLEREQFQFNEGQVGIRIEAFLEMIEGRK